MLIDKTTIVTNDLVIRKDKIINAVYAYIFDGQNLKKLSKTFGVSQNTIAEWFCEAVSEKYIASDSLCASFMRKHIAEYEYYNNIQNSCLRIMYQSAFDIRNKKVTTTIITNSATSIV